MTIADNLKNGLRLKTLLIDTCTLNTVRLHTKNEGVQTFLQTLNTLQCTPAIHDLIKAEYFRDANKKIELDGRKNFVEKLCQNFSLPIPGQVFKDATVLSYMYVRNQHKGIALVDLINSVLLKKFNANLVLVTENHKDYPITVHDRIGTIVLDLGKTLATLGFYTINSQKWQNEIHELLNSGEWNG
jgi:hypothetical protein